MSFVRAQARSRKINANPDLHGADWLAASAGLSSNRSDQKIPRQWLPSREAARVKGRAFFAAEAAMSQPTPRVFLIRHISLRRQW